MNRYDKDSSNCFLRKIKLTEIESDATRISTKDDETSACLGKISVIFLKILDLQINFLFSGSGLVTRFEKCNQSASNNFLSYFKILF